MWLCHPGGIPACDKSFSRRICSPPFPYFTSFPLLHFIPIRYNTSFPLQHFICPPTPHFPSYTLFPFWQDSIKFKWSFIYAGVLLSSVLNYRTNGTLSSSVPTLMNNTFDMCVKDMDLGVVLISFMSSNPDSVPSTVVSCSLQVRCHWWSGLLNVLLLWVGGRSILPSLCLYVITSHQYLLCRSAFGDGFSDDVTVAKIPSSQASGAKRPRRFFGSPKSDQKKQLLRISTFQYFHCNFTVQWRVANYKVPFA